MRSLQSQSWGGGLGSCFYWMVGQVDRWHWVVLAGSGYRVRLQHVCHTHCEEEGERERQAHSHMAQRLELFVCPQLFSYLFISFAFSFAIVVPSATWSCFIILRLFLIFCALSLCFFLFILAVIYTANSIQTYVSTVAELMRRIMEPHSFSYARIMQSNARVCRVRVLCSPSKSINCRVARAHIKQFAYKDAARAKTILDSNLKLFIKAAAAAADPQAAPSPLSTAHALPHMSIKLARPRCCCHGHNSSQRSALNSAAAALLRQQNGSGQRSSGGVGGGRLTTPWGQQLMIV